MYIYIYGWRREIIGGRACGGWYLYWSECEAGGLVSRMDEDMVDCESKVLWVPLERANDQ